MKELFVGELLADFCIVDSMCVCVCGSWFFSLQLEMNFCSHFSGKVNSFKSHS